MNIRQPSTQRAEPRFDHDGEYTTRGTVRVDAGSRSLTTVRWVGALGAVVYAIGFFLVSSAPGGGDVKTADFEKFYVTDDAAGMVLLGQVALSIGVMALLWFFHVLRTSIGGDKAAFGWAAAAMGLTLAAAGGGVLTGPAGVQIFSDADFVGAPVAHAFSQAGYAIVLGPAVLLLGLGIGVLSLLARRTAVMPAWVAVAGFVAAALQVFSFIWMPSFAIPLWILVASLAGFRAADRAVAS